MISVVKIGGNIVDNPQKLRQFLRDFAALSGNKILIHGGGKVATTVSKALGIETTMVGGRRVTDAETIKVVTMVYAGGINKSIVGQLRSNGCNALGLCGVDGGLIVSDKRSPEPVDYGFVGDPRSVNVDLLRVLTERGFTVVCAPITATDQGELLNTNADTVAQTIATALAESAMDVELVYCFEKAGVLMNVDDDNSVIPSIDQKSYLELKEKGIVADGMLPKLDNAFSALKRGVSKVVICNADNLLCPGYGGTSILLNK